MKLRINSWLPLLFVFCLAAILWTKVAVAGDYGHDHEFTVTSSTFKGGATLPLSTIYADSGCTYNGAIGGDVSPELSWRNAPRGTRSFVVVLYDVTASFTHWGMYDISGNVNRLPANAGAAGSSYGKQVSNDFGDLSYDGPCPPMTLTPYVHQYVFTVYALNAPLPTIPTYGDFSPGAEALYHALIRAGREDHILASASITGEYASTAPPGN
ncbi:MAG TPA: YbhB/YbcL family Raf kinase inhibitor-like protein [Candidatus Acidoferrales bacterium]|nr:YbhB/YbcL family Raf kinase inhibitor-like protein [Candidatus Acidoferrales bacterium]